MGERGGSEKLPALRIKKKYPVTFYLLNHLNLVFLSQLILFVTCHSVGGTR